MRRVLLALLVLLGLLVAADRGGLLLAERVVARQLQRSADLPASPEVDLGGGLFLPQLLRGRYPQVEVRAVRVPAGEVQVAELDVVLRGVRLPLADLVRGVRSLPVDQVRAEALVDYAALSRAAGEGLSVGPGDESRVRVTGRARVLGQDLSVAALSRVELAGQAVRVTPEQYETGLGLADAVVTRALGGRFDVVVPLERLPLGLQLDRLRVTRRGVVASASAQDAVLGPAVA